MKIGIMKVSIMLVLTMIFRSLDRYCKQLTLETQGTDKISDRLIPNVSDGPIIEWLANKKLSVHILMHKFVGKNKMKQVALLFSKFYWYTILDNLKFTQLRHSIFNHNSYSREKYTSK